MGQVKNLSYINLCIFLSFGLFTGCSEVELGDRRRAVKDDTLVKYITPELKSWTLFKLTPPSYDWRGRFTLKLKVADSIDNKSALYYEAEFSNDIDIYHCEVEGFIKQVWRPKGYLMLEKSFSGEKRAPIKSLLDDKTTENPQFIRGTFQIINDKHIVVKFSSKCFNVGRRLTSYEDLFTFEFNNMHQNK